jgi:Bacterial antitoxin of type II TA system, VapB
MGTHMKTTLDINDALMAEAKALAASERRTLRDVIEVALRCYLQSARAQPTKAFRLKPATFRGKGLQPGLQEGDWASVRDRIYGDRGG